MKKANLILRFLLEWALICVGVLGAMYCLTTPVDFGLQMPPAVLVIVPILALFFCLLFNGKTGKYYALGVLGILLIGLWLFRKEIFESFRCLWFNLGSTYDKAYRDLFPDLEQLIGAEPELKIFNPSLVTLAVLETYISALAVRLWKRTSPMALVLLLSIAPCFVVLDTHPNLPALLSAVFAVLTLAFSQSARRRETGEQAKAIALSALLSAALLVALLLIFPQESYTKPFTWDGVNERVTDWRESNALKNLAKAGLAGNPSEIDLTALPALPKQAVSTLRVTSTTKASVYLRGSSYVGFEGSRWTRGELWKNGKNDLFPYLGRPGGNRLTIQTDDTEPVLFTTYQIFDLPGGTVYADSYLENRDGVSVYSMRYTQDAEAVIPNEAYDSWVREHCLDVPKRTRTGVLDWWEKVDGREAPSPELSPNQSGRESTADTAYTDPDTLEQFARSVAARVSQAAVYSRNPVRVPEGEDFCTWFLNDAEEGYCVHFATACAALLRSLGVPARYVSGYVCTLPANRPVEVTSLQAHAWVEIWCGGRWIVIEATPDEALEFSGTFDPYTNSHVETTAPLPPPPSEEITLPPPETRPTQEPTERAAIETSAPDATKRPGPGGSNHIAEKRDLTPLWIFLGIFGFVGLIVGRRYLILWLRERRFRQAKPNQRARLLYRQLLRLHRLGSNPVPDKATEIARKAAFSQYELSDEEIACLRQLYDKQRGVLQYYSIWKRIWCKYVLVVI